MSNEQILIKYKEYLNGRITKSRKAKKVISDKTIRATYDDVRLFLERVDESYSDVNEDTIIDYLKKDSPSTAQRRSVSLNDFFVFAASNGFIEKSPVTQKVFDSLRKVVSEIADFMTQEEGMRFLQESKRDPKQYAIMMVYLNTGLRLMEVANLQRSKYIKRGGRAYLSGIGKNDKPFSKPLNNGTITAIDAYLSARNDKLPNLFISSHMKKYSASGLRYLVETIGNKAGIGRKVKPHALRHTYLNAAQSTGATKFEIQKLAEHSSFSTTERYLHTIEDPRMNMLADACVFGKE